MYMNCRLRKHIYADTLRNMMAFKWKLYQNIQINQFEDSSV